MLRDEVMSVGSSDVDGRSDLRCVCIHPSSQPAIHDSLLLSYDCLLFLSLLSLSFVVAPYNFMGKYLLFLCLN